MKTIFLALVSLILSASLIYAQNDTMYVMKSGVIINKQSIKLADVDSVIFYKPVIIIPPDAPNTASHVSRVLIPTGTFTMGSPGTEVDRDPSETQHSVTLSAFYMSKYEITNAQFAAFLNAKGIGSNGTNPVTSKYLITESYAINGIGDWGLHYTNSQWVPVAGYENHPIIFVNWDGANEFATYVGGALPTESQWEYACRAGTTTPFSTGNFLTNLQANYDWEYPYNGGTNTVPIKPGKTQAVGTYAPNAYGLYDMQGNVWEWVADKYGTYPSSPQTNPTGDPAGVYPILRGGGWQSRAYGCRSAYRTYGQPYSSMNNLGFRVVFAP